MDYRYFGLLAFSILACGLGFIVWKWPQGKHLTFSQHVAVARHTILYYILLFSIALPLLVVFFLQWFVPTFHLSVWFSICLVAAAVAQLACTLIPEVGGWRTRYHRVLAGASGAFLAPPLLMLVAAPSITSAGKVMAILSLLVMIGVVATLILKRGKKYALILQIVYYAAFFAPMLFISYLA